MHTCGEEISHVSTSPLTEHSVHDSAIPKRNHGLWVLASSELAMPQASPGGLAELARIKARVPSLPLSPAAETAGIRGLGPRARGLPVARGKESSTTTDSSSLVQAGLASAAITHVIRAQGWAGSGHLHWGRSCYLQEFCLMGATSGLRLDSRAGLRGAPRRGFSLVGGRRSCVPGALSGCGVSGTAAPVCWMNCCRLH